MNVMSEFVVVVLLVVMVSFFSDFLDRQRSDATEIGFQTKRRAPLIVQTIADFYGRNDKIEGVRLMIPRVPVKILSTRRSILRNWAHA